MPARFDCVVIDASHIPEWPGCHIQFVGADCSELWFPPKWPRFIGELDSGEHVELVLVRAQLRLSAHAALVLEILWDQGIDHESMHGLESEPTAADVERLRRLRQRLKELPRVGRPQTDKEGFLRDVATAWWKFVDDKGRRPKQEEIANALALIFETFKRKRRRNIGVNWPQYRPPRP
jgi:hypothetical protein